MTSAHLNPLKQGGSLEPEFDAAVARVFELVNVGRMCATLWRDMADCKEHRCEVAYAVDTDIIKMYSDPSTHASYGQIFQGSKDSDSNTADLLGDFILRRWPGILTWSDQSLPATEQSPLSPLAMIEPHSEELLDIEFALREKTTVSAGKNTLLRNGNASKKYWGELEQLLASLPNFKRAPVLFRRMVDDEILADPRRESTAEEELSRLETIGSTRLVKLRRHPWFSDSQSGVASSLLRQGDLDSEEGKQLAQAAASWELPLKRWYQKFARRGNGKGDQSDASTSGPDERALSRHRLQKIRIDAAVLARLEVVNRRFAEEHSLSLSSTHPLRARRFVLISGTRAIHEVAEERKDCFHAGFENFGEAYLRDPKALLAAPDTLADPDFAERTTPLGWKNTEIRVADLLSRWFPRHCSHDEFDKVDGTDTLSSISRKIVFEPPTNDEVAHAVTVSQAIEPSLLHELVHLPEQWSELTQRLCELLALRRLGEREIAFTNRINRALPETSENQKLDWGVAALVKVARTQVLESIRSIHLQADWLGAAQLAEAGIKIRGLPALRLDCLSAVGQRSFEEFCAELFADDGVKRRNPEQLRQLYAEFRDHDPSDYHADLLLAYVFASAGKWPQVRLQCYVAIMGVELDWLKERSSHPTEVSTLDGREASYLLAVAERRLLHDARGLDQARAALRDAMTLPVETGNPIDLRFESEQLAQFVAETQLGPKSRLAKGEYERWLARAQLLVGRGRQESNRPVRRWVIRQAVTNGLLLALFSKEAGFLPIQQVRAQAQFLINSLQEEELAPDLGKRKKQLYPDGISDFVWLVGVVALGATSDDYLCESAKALIRQRYLNLESIPFASSLERNRHRRLLKFAGLEARIEGPESGTTELLP